MKTSQKKSYRIRRHKRIRAKISGTAQRPRIAVFRSNRHVFVQAVDDDARKTLASAGDLKSKKAPASAKDIRGAKEKNAYGVGEQLGNELKKLGVDKAVFDTGGSKYHGRVKALAEGLRGAGIKI